MSRSALAPSLLAAVVLLAACGSGDGSGDRASSDEHPAPSSASAAPGTPGPAEPAGHDTVDEAAGSGSAAPTAPGRPMPNPPVGPAPNPPASGTSASGTTAPGTTAPDGEGLHDPDGAGPLPAEVIVRQGSVVWAVYLATGSPGDEWEAHSLGETEAYLTGIYGYAGSGIGAVHCDDRAEEELGFSHDDDRLAVYFATAEDAQAFVAVYDRRDVGSALVSTYCRT